MPCMAASGLLASCTAGLVDGTVWVRVQQCLVSGSICLCHSGCPHIGIVAIGLGSNTISLVSFAMYFGVSLVLCGSLLELAVLCPEVHGASLG